MNVTDISGVRTEVMGSRRVCFEGCDGIEAYSEEEIRVKAGRLCICLRGRALQIAFFSREGIVVEGVLKELSYSYGHGRE